MRNSPVRQGGQEDITTFVLYRQLSKTKFKKNLQNVRTLLAKISWWWCADTGHNTPDRTQQTCSQKHFQNESYIKHVSAKPLSAKSPHEEK